MVLARQIEHTDREFDQFVCELYCLRRRNRAGRTTNAQRLTGSRVQLFSGERNDQPLCHRLHSAAASATKRLLWHTSGTRC
jgi:hypothetical protein